MRSIRLYYVRSRETKGRFSFWSSGIESRYIISTHATRAEILIITVFEMRTQISLGSAICALRVIPDLIGGFANPLIAACLQGLVKPQELNQL
jgi:hypothetical protein